MLPGEEPTLRILAVVVLYKTPWHVSRTVLSLRAQLADVDICLYDNSPELPPDQVLPLRHHHDPSNGGLVAAYAWATKVASERGAEWILLLDQDTELPPGYIETFRVYAASLAPDTVAVVPRVVCGNEVVSPKAVIAGVPGIIDLPATRWGIQREELSAINSGAFIRLAYLHESGGFVSRNKLDGVDRLFFDGVYSNGKNVFLLPLTIAHDLSISDLRSINIERWRSISDGEREFFERTRSRGVRALAASLMLWRAISPRVPLSIAARKVTLSECFRLARTLVKK